MQFWVSTQLILHSTLSTSAFKRLDWASSNCVHQKDQHHTLSHLTSLSPFAVMFEELKTGSEITSDLVVSAFPTESDKKFIQHGRKEPHTNF